MSVLLQEVFLHAFGGLESNTSGDHCPPMGAAPGPILVPALAGISGGCPSCDCHSRFHPWALLPAAACWGIALGNLRGTSPAVLWGCIYHLPAFKPWTGLWCSPLIWLCLCLARNPPDPNKIQKTDLKRWGLMCFCWWNLNSCPLVKILSKLGLHLRYVLGETLNSGIYLTDI